jgi:uncharacterized SAM-binding protein YcdF (DUF218 family)
MTPPPVTSSDRDKKVTVGPLTNDRLPAHSDPTSNCNDQLGSKGRWWPALLIAAGLAFLLVAFGYATHGKALAEKTLTALVMPLGIIWLLCTGRMIQLLVSGPRSGMSGLIGLWLVLTICGTRPLPRMATRWLESSVAAYDPKRDGPLDVVVVLGGGTSAGHWRAQASGAGDRLVMAAELYHQGRTKRLITTGQVTEGVSDAAPNPADQTTEIWTQLAIPNEDIQKLGGRNTFEEMLELKRIWPDLNGQRVGLLTSANHLPRAVRLAKAQGLNVVPIAADVRTAVNDWGLLHFIPHAGNFAELASTQHEFMASLVSR